MLAFGGFVGGYFARQATTLAADYEKAAVSFEVMTKSATRGKKLIDDLNKLAVESPFTSAELRESAKQVMAFGFDADNVIPIVSRLGDIAQATGSDMDRLTLALGQVRTTGRLMGQELRQFTNAGVPILEYLSKSLGVSSAQVPNLVRQGKVSFNDVADAINRMTNEGGLFHGMMERINKETVTGRWANFRENVQQSALALGLAAFDGLRLKDVLTDLSETVRGGDMNTAREVFMGIRLAVYSAYQAFLKLYEVIRNNRETLKYFVASILLINGIALAASILSWVAAWIAWLGPIILVNAAIGFLIYQLGLLDSSTIERFTQSFQEMAPAMQKAFAAIKDAIEGNDLQLAFDILSDAIKMGWRRLWQDLAIESARGVINLVKEALGAFKSIGDKIGGTGLNILFPGLGILGKNSGEWSKQLDDWFNMHEGNRRKEQEQDLQRFQNRVDEHSRHAAITKLFPKGTLGGQISSGVYDAFNNPNFNESAFRQSIIGGNRSGLGGVFIQSRLNTLLQDAIEATMKVHGKISNPEGNPESLEELKRSADEAIKRLEKFQQSIKGVGNAVGDIMRTFQISPAALHAASELQKDYDKGTSALQRFQRQAGLLNEAFLGPFANHPTLRNIKGGIFGNLFQQGGALTKDARDFGIFQAFQQLQKEVGGNRDKYAPAMMGGSREAAEVIQRSSDQSLSVEQQVLQVLRDSKIVQDQAAAYQKRVVDILLKNPEAARGAGLGPN